MECEKTHQSPRKAAKGQVFPIVSGVRYSRSNAGLKTRNLPHGWVPRMNLEPISANQVASTVQKKKEIGKNGTGKRKRKRKKTLQDRVAEFVR